MSTTQGKTGGLGGVFFGWIKAVITGVLGLLSGAVLMYVSPWVEKAIKPAKPVANFGVQVDGLKATFVNQAEGSEGWWDFGDGSPLQPFAPDQKTFTHDYQKPGGYTAKLLLRNLFGDENHREVNIHLDGTTARPPAIEAFEVQPLDPTKTAPATFRITTKITGAELLVWACGNDQPIEVVSDPPESQERYITFHKQGQYLIKLAAVHGKQIVEKSQSVVVLPAVLSTPMAKIVVQNQMTPVKILPSDRTVVVPLPGKVDSGVHKFSQEIRADFGSKIVAAKFAQPEQLPHIQNANLSVEEGGAKAILTGEYLPAKVNAGQKSSTPKWAAPVKLTVEKKGAEVTSGAPIWMPLKLSGKTAIPLPKSPQGWKLNQRTVQLELYDGQQLVWKEPKLPQKASVYIYGSPYMVTASEVGDQLVIDVQPGKKAVPPPPPVLWNP
jgi:hypothetical protein